ncbi:MAG: hypothetical protein AAGJ40_02910 [Planctomycetota bacterium]
MPWPIWYNGSILFDDGGLAMHEDCCCGGPVPNCTLDCFFSVGDAYYDGGAVQDYIPGGATQITNLFAQAETPEGIRTIIEQWPIDGSSLSRHQVSFETLQGDGRTIKRSRCFWSVPTRQYVLDEDDNLVVLPGEEPFVYEDVIVVYTRLGWVVAAVGMPADEAGTCSGTVTSEWETSTPSGTGLQNSITFNVNGESISSPYSIEDQNPGSQLGGGFWLKNGRRVGLDQLPDNVKNDLLFNP